MHRLALLSLFLLATPCRAQEGLARYTAFVEIMGNAGVASLNADAAYGNGYGFRIGGFELAAVAVTEHGVGPEALV
jgi:hypothetical protein